MLFPKVHFGPECSECVRFHGAVGAIDEAIRMFGGRAAKKESSHAD